MNIPWNVACGLAFAVHFVWPKVALAQAVVDQIEMRRVLGVSDLLKILLVSDKNIVRLDVTVKIACLVNLLDDAQKLNSDPRR